MTIVRRIGFQALAALLGFAPLAAFATPTAAAGAVLTIQSGGKSRSALIVERHRLKAAPRPTLVVLHGQNGSGLRARRNLGLEDLKAPGVAVVYPNALDGRWDLDTDRDITFVRDLVAKLVADRVADPRRIYLVGASTGGVLVYRLACGHAPLFAGFAALIATMTAADAATCRPGAPLAALAIAGVADPIVPYGGGKSALADFKGDLASIDASLAPFRRAAECGEKKTVELPDRDPLDGSRVFVDRWQNCRRPVDLVRVEGGGHALPGRVRLGLDRGQPVGAQNKDVDAAKLVTDFFKRAGG